MAKLVVEHQEEILTFPADTILELKIEDVTSREVQSRRDNSSWTKLEFKFKVLGIQATGDGSPISAYDNWITREVYGSVPARLTDSPENRLRIWAEAIFQQELGVGFELDTDMFIGRRVRGLMSQYETQGRDAQGKPTPRKRHQVETLLPFGGGGGAPAAAPSAPVATQAAPAVDPWGAAPGGDPWGGGGSSEPPF